MAALIKHSSQYKWSGVEISACYLAALYVGRHTATNLEWIISWAHAYDTITLLVNGLNTCCNLTQLDDRIIHLN